MKDNIEIRIENIDSFGNFSSGVVLMPQEEVDALMQVVEILNKGRENEYAPWVRVRNLTAEKEAAEKARLAALAAAEAADERRRKAEARYRGPQPMFEGQRFQSRGTTAMADALRRAGFVA